MGIGFRKKEKSNYPKSTNRSCLISVAIFIIICCIVTLIYSNMSSETPTDINWSSDTINFTNINDSKTAFMQVSGEKPANKILCSEFIIEISDSNVCDVDYVSADRSGITFNIIPLSSGYSSITVIYAGISTDPLQVSVTLPEEESSIVNTETTTTTEEVATTTTEEVTTTTETTTQITEDNPNDYIAVYVTPTGSKYHYNSNCNGGTYNESSLTQALKRGLEPCKKCVG